MDEERDQGAATGGQGEIGDQGPGAAGREDIKSVIREVLTEFVDARQRTETLERRVNELVAEAEEARRSAAVRAELQRLGVAKIDLAYKAVKEDVRGMGDGNELRNFLEEFVNDNPELLPARLAGGSGASGAQRTPGIGEAIDLAQIRPGMSKEEMDRVRKEVARVAAQTLRGQI